MNYKLLLLLSILFISGFENAYSKGKKVTQGVYFEGSLDFEKQPRGEGILHFYWFDPYYTSTDTKTEILAISGTFQDKEITNAELKSGDCIIKGDIVYSLSKDLMRRNVLSLTFKSVMFISPQLTTKKAVSSEKPLKITLATKMESNETVEILLFDEKESYIGGQKSADNIARFQDIASAFGSSIAGYSKICKIEVWSGKIKLAVKPGDMVLTNDGHALQLTIQDNTFLREGEYYNLKGENVSFANGPYGLYISQAHIISDYDVVYDGEWSSPNYGQHLNIKIKYPDGSKYEGSVNSDFLKPYNNTVGLHLYQLLKKADKDFLKPLKGVFTGSDGSTTNIDN